MGKPSFDSNLCPVGREFSLDHPTCKSCRIGCLAKDRAKPSETRAVSSKDGMRVETEEAEQIAFAQYLDLYFHGEWFHVPNGGKRSKAVAGKLKAQGVKRGVPDNFILRPTKGAPGVVVELKRLKGGVVSEEQEGWIALLQSFGWIVGVCKGAHEAINFVKEVYGK